MKTKQQNKTLRYGLSFLGFVIVLYFFLFFFNPEKTHESLITSLKIVIQILPVLFLVVFLMGLSNYFLKPKTVMRYLGEESGIKGWLLAISLGIFSHGSIYIWYPLLKNLRDRGMRTGLIVVFLCNRAVKIPLIPLMLYYFSVSFVIVLTIYIIIASVFEGKLVEMIDHTFSKEGIKSD